MFLFSPYWYAAAATGVQLGAHTLLGQYEGDSTTPAVTAARNTQATGGSFLAFYAGYSSNNSTPTDNKSNTYSQVGSAVDYAGFSGIFNFKLYKKDNGAGGSGHTVSVVKNGQANGEIVVGFVEITGCLGMDQVSQTYASSGTTHTSGSLTVANDSVLIAIWSGDGSTTDTVVSPGSGFTEIENFTDWPPGDTSVQTAVAYRRVSAGTYSASWSVSPDQGAILYLIAFDADGPAFVATPVIGASSVAGFAGVTDQALSSFTAVANEPIVVLVGYGGTSGTDGSVTSVTDSLSNTYVRQGTVVTSGVAADVWACMNPTGGTCVITVHFGATDYPSICRVQTTGYAGHAALDFSVNNTDGSDPRVITAAGPTAQAKEIIFTMYASSSDPQTYNTPSGFTNIGAVVDAGQFWTAAFAYRIISSIETPSASWSSVSATGSPGVQKLLALKAS